MCSDPGLSHFKTLVILQYIQTIIIRAETKATPVLPAESEAKLWDAKILSMDATKELLKAAFFY